MSHLRHLKCCFLSPLRVAVVICCLLWSSWAGIAAALPVGAPIEGRVAFFGDEPLAGVLVFGGELGIAETDEDGRFGFSGAETGRQYKLTPILSFYEFTPGAFEASGGSSVSFMPSIGYADFNGCSYTAQRDIFLMLNDFGLQIKDAAVAPALALRRDAIAIADPASRSSARRLANRSIRRLGRSFGTLIDALLVVPDVAVLCEDHPECEIQGLTERNSSVVNIFATLTRQALQTVTRTHAARGVSRSRTRRLHARIRSFSHQAQESAAGLASVHHNCPVFHCSGADSFVC